MKKQSQPVDNSDEFIVQDYQKMPENQEDYEYLVFEVPKTLSKKQ